VYYTNQALLDPKSMDGGMPASLLWFHDHAFGATRLNVFAGLAAAYILRDEFDTGAVDNPIGIPAGAYEMVASGIRCKSAGVVPASWSG
jgi:hypothetical protein